MLDNWSSKVVVQGANPMGFSQDCCFFSRFLFFMTKAGLRPQLIVLGALLVASARQLTLQVIDSLTQTPYQKECGSEST